VAADSNGLLPAGDAERYVLAQDGLAEDGAVEDVADGAVGRLPHLLEVELLDTGLIGGDGGALDADLFACACWTSQQSQKQGLERGRSFTLYFWIALAASSVTWSFV